MTQNLEHLVVAFAFLDRLRCIGAAPHLEEVFDLEPDEARKVWSLWAKTFALGTSPEERAAMALAAERPH